jgi:hypothetical protein
MALGSGVADSITLKKFMITDILQSILRVCDHHQNIMPYYVAKKMT